MKIINCEKLNFYIVIIIKKLGLFKVVMEEEFKNWVEVLEILIEIMLLLLLLNVFLNFDDVVVDKLNLEEEIDRKIKEEEIIDRIEDEINCF